MAPKRHNLQDGFWEQVDKSAGPDGCWPFKKLSQTRDLRGMWWFDGKPIYAHRVAYELTKGSLKHNCLHTCDNSICCNPKHLYDGTQQQNVQDRVDRNRDGGNKRRGKGNGRTKLSEQDVEQIKLLRFEGLTYQKIANIYKINKTHVGNIVRGISW